MAMDLGSVNAPPPLEHRQSGVGWSIERNYEQTKNFNKSLALVAGPGPKLQAASVKLQASSSKLDKTKLQCYCIL